MKDLLRAVSHLALQSQPVTLSEMRELILRHLISAPDVFESREITRNLFNAYRHMVLSEAPKDNFVTYEKNRFIATDEAAIKKFFQGNYMLGLMHGLNETGATDTLGSFDAAYVPANLPLHILEYPKDIVEQFAAVMGYMKATGRMAA